MGIHNSKKVALAASMASFLTSLSDLQYHFPNIDVIKDNYFYEIRNISTIIQQEVSDKKVTKYQIDKLVYDYGYNSKLSTEKLQQNFFKDLTEESKEKFTEKITNINDNLYLNWITSLTNTMSGAFLLACPKINTSTVFTNIDFSTTLKIRLFLNFNQIASEQRCKCKVKNIHPIIDKKAHHLISGCNKGGNHFAYHMNIEQELNRLFTYCGLKCTVEQKHCFRQLENSDNKRPDICIKNYHLLGYSQEIILDLSIVTPFTGVQNGILEPISIKNAKHKLRNANIRAKQKVTKYEESCKRNNYLFIPFIFETSGAIHNEGEKLLHKIATYGANLHNIPFTIFYNYIFKSISSTLHRAIANRLYNNILSLNAPHCALPAAFLKSIDDPDGLDILKQDYIHATTWMQKIKLVE